MIKERSESKANEFLAQAMEIQSKDMQEWQRVLAPKIQSVEKQSITEALRPKVRKSLFSFIFN